MFIDCLVVQAPVALNPACPDSSGIYQGFIGEERNTYSTFARQVGSGGEL